MPEHVDVAVIGGGLAGLGCARRLRARGREPVVLEAADDVGGRVRTDVVEGFRLDRGFQVLLTAYPEARRVLDYGALDLRPFSPGVLVRRGRSFQRLSDPFRRPRDLLGSAVSRVGTPLDKLRIAALRRQLRRARPDQLRRRPDIPTIAELRRQGFSDDIIESFFRPFLGSIFFDRELQTSSRMYAYVMRSFFLGSAAVPATGMAAIPAQLAGDLPNGSVRVRTPVTGVSGARVSLGDGDLVTADAVVVATGGAAAARLVTGLPDVRSRGGTTVYFSASGPPIEEPTLILDGDRRGPADLVAVVSNAAPSYAPAGAALIATAVAGPDGLDDDRLEAGVRHQLGDWFGSQVRDWRRIGLYRIPDALPDQTAPARVVRPVRLDAVTFVCGDHRDTGSIQGALVSGRRAADAVVAAGT